jgi:hypothetical protein
MVVQVEACKDHIPPGRMRVSQQGSLRAGTPSPRLLTASPARSGHHAHLPHAQPVQHAHPHLGAGRGRRGSVSETHASSGPRAWGIRSGWAGWPGCCDRRRKRRRRRNGAGPRRPTACRDTNAAARLCARRGMRTASAASFHQTLLSWPPVPAHLLGQLGNVLRLRRLAGASSARPAAPPARLAQPLALQRRTSHAAAPGCARAAGHVRRGGGVFRFFSQRLTPFVIRAVRARACGCGPHHALRRAVPARKPTPHQNKALAHALYLLPGAGSSGLSESPPEPSASPSAQPAPSSSPCAGKTARSAPASHD